MTILVTGGAGYIGGHMVLGLLDAGQQPIVLDNLSTGYRWSVPAGVKLIVGDFGDEALVSQIIAEHGITGIAHFAAKIVVPESVTDPLGYYLNNTVKARSLIDCAVKSGVKHFIFSSTASIYGDQGLAPVAEDAPLKPESPYGRSKLMVEWMLEDTARAHDFSYVALRYFNVAGGDPQGRMGQSTPGSTHLIKRAVQVALGQRPSLQIFGTDYPTPDGTCVRDYVQITDLINAHLLALEYLQAGGKSIVCNCGYGRGLSVRDVIGAVKRVSGVDFETIIAPRRAGDPAAYVAANNRIKSELGWRAKHDNLDEIVAQALNWERRLHNRRLIET